MSSSMLRRLSFSGGKNVPPINDSVTRIINSSDIKVNKYGLVSNQLTYSYKWIIDNNKLKSKEIISPQFKYRRSHWHMEINTGSGSDNEYVDINLCLDACHQNELTINFRLYAINAQKSIEIHHKLEENKILIKNGSKVMLKVLHQRTFFDFMNDSDSLMLKLDIIESHKEIIEPDINLQATNNLICDFNALYENKLHADFKFILKGKTFLVHKSILAARSPVFAAMFRHQTKEAQEQKAEIIDFDANVFEEMLRFIYTGRAPNIEKLVEKLLAISDKYCIKDLKLFCSHIIFKNLCPENAIETLILADNFNDTDLINKVINYFSINKSAIKNSSPKKWKQFIKDHHLLICRLFEELV